MRQDRQNLPVWCRCVGVLDVEADRVEAAELEEGMRINSAICEATQHRAQGDWHLRVGMEDQADVDMDHVWEVMRFSLSVTDLGWMSMSHSTAGGVLLPCGTGRFQRQGPRTRGHGLPQARHNILQGATDIGEEDSVERD